MAKEDILYQHGTLALLVPGLYDGTLSVAQLQEHGDTGIGTADGLDGEMVMLDGVAYQIRGDGTVREMDKTELTPFANAHFAQATNQYDRQDMSSTALTQEIFTDHDFSNLFMAVTITGTFKNVKTRAIDKQRPPYRPLATVASTQHVFTREKVTGTLIGYYSPDLYQGITSAGFHLHFLSDAHDFGGHVLAYELATGTVQLQTFSDFYLHLPGHDSRYRTAQFDTDDLANQIQSAEN